MAWLAKQVVGTEGQDAFTEAAHLCEQWVTQHGTSGSSELVIKVEAMASAQGWSSREVGIMLGMLMVTLVANSSDAAGWILIATLQSPSLFETVRAEVDSLPRSASNSTRPNLTRPPHVPMLDSAVQETLRLFTSTLSARVATEDFTLATSDPPLRVRMKRGDRVIVPTRVLHLDPTIWGADVKAWRGDRFLGDVGRRRKSQMAPYGGGSSICSGRHFAAVELSAVAIIFFSAFDFDIQHSTMVDRTGQPVPGLPLPIVDIDGKNVVGRWPGIHADTDAVQSGVFKAGPQMICPVRVRQWVNK